MSRRKYPALFLLCALYARQFASGAPVTAQDVVSPADARAIAKEAYIFGFPLVDGYRIQYAYFVDRDNPEFRCALAMRGSPCMPGTPLNGRTTTRRGSHHHLRGRTAGSCESVL